jgi:hypothetical protein
MRAFSKPNSTRRSSTCSYCGDTDHQVNECPHAESDWASLKQGTIPLNSVTPRSWYKLPKYWSDWYKQAETAVSKIEAARNRANKKRTASTTPRKCGFCGDTSHTRRTCGHMASFVTKCEKANENWRREAYRWLVDNGLYVGSAIKVRERNWNGDGAEHVALVTSINLDEINVMSGFSTRWYSDPASNYIQPVEITVQADGRSHRLGIGKLPKTDSPVAEKSFAYYAPYEYVCKLTSNATPPSEDWVTSYKAAWTWLAKRKSYEWLKDNKIVDHIETWAAKAQ